MPEDTMNIDRYGLYMGLLKVHYMCEASGAYSGWDKDILNDWISKHRDRRKPRRRY